jgi:cobalamin biosynthesis protein CobD/CbiB
MSRLCAEFLNKYSYRRDSENRIQAVGVASVRTDTTRDYAAARLFTFCMIAAESMP